MAAMIIIKPKPCSKHGHAHWTLPPSWIHAVRVAFLPQKDHCKYAAASCCTPERKAMKDVILIDAGTGNLRSVQKALETVGANVRRTDDPQTVLTGKRVILPGVGAFGDFMAGLRERGLDDAVKDITKYGIPLLGICVGMQALFDVGEEMGAHAGLGLLPGKVVKFEESLSVKIPHTGWNQLEARKDAPL